MRSVTGALTRDNGTYLIQDAIGYRQKVKVEKEGYVPIVQETVFENSTNELNFKLSHRSIFVLAKRDVL